MLPIATERKLRVLGLTSEEIDLALYRLSNAPQTPDNVAWEGELYAEIERWACWLESRGYAIRRPGQRGPA